MLWASVINPTRRACALHPVKTIDRYAGHSQAVRQDPADGIPVQGRIENATAGADSPEHLSRAALGHLLPAIEGTLRGSLNMLAARQPDLRPLPCLIGLGTQNADTQTAGYKRHLSRLAEASAGALQPC